MARIAIVALAVVFLVGGSGAAACKFALSCGLDRLGYGEPGPGGDVPPVPNGRVSLPDGWRERTVVAGLRFPTDFEFLPSGDVVVSEKTGLIRVATPGTSRSRVVLDLRSRVSTSTYRGLLTVSLDPAFPREPYVYLLYTAAVGKTDAPTMSHVSRFTWRHGRLDPSSERRIVSIAVEQQHAGGQIAFAPDGTLFVSTGDGVHSEVVPKALIAQDVDALQGKVLHVTREGEGVPQNPFWNGKPDAARSKVWAYGFRNPFRLALPPASIAPVVGDVGYKGEAEISVAARGSNNGWPCYEGVSRGPAGYEDTDVCEELDGRGESAHNRPVVSFEYDDSASITGGAFLAGEAIGSEAQLVYVFADFSYGWLRYLELDEERLQPNPIAFAEGLPGPVALHAGRDGALYYLSATTGELRRVERDR